jgi:hypothetical protein
VHNVVGSLRAIKWDIVPEIMDVSIVIHMCMAKKDSINATRFFRGEFTVVEVIAPIYAFQIRKQAKFKEIEYTVTLAGLHKLIKILVGKAEAHPEIEKQSCILILDEDFVAPNLVDSSVKREGGHTNA